MTTRPPLAADLERAAARAQRGSEPPRAPESTFPDYVPAHVAYEHLVLRFYAYFRESVPESRAESSRVRYVRVHVYLEDGTVMIEESPVRNSGIPQGVILRRMPVANPAGGLYAIRDFNVGVSLNIFGITYRIYACDEFTEDYFKSEGMPLNDFESAPDDLYTIKRRLTDRPIRISYTNTDKVNLRRFLDLDGKVLRFYCTWDDRRAVFGERRKFVLHFFLVDGTIEIRQVLPLNSGRDPVSRFLSRTRLEKPGSGEYYLASDLQIGAVVDVFGRSFFLYDADTFTKQFLDSKYGPHNWTPIDIDETCARSSSHRAKTPPYNGWGDEEDSLGSVHRLNPRPPRKDIAKLIANDGRVLRFSATLKSPQPQDSRRRFVIVYYLADDTVAVFEREQRNSGFLAGRMIQRGRWKNAAVGNRNFLAADFKVGDEVTINGFTFLTNEADEYALNYMEAQAQEFPQANLVDIVEMCRVEKERVECVRKEFEKSDPENRGYVDVENAESVIMEIFGLPKHETLTVVRRWTQNRGFDYFEFMSALL
jgi:hypothetical protein